MWEVFMLTIGFTAGFIVSAFMSVGGRSDEAYNPYDPERTP